MKRLGELLLERGAIDVGELHTGLEACHRSGGRLGTQLLRFGFVEERALLEALSIQFGVPFVSEGLIQKASLAVRKCLPMEVMRRLMVMPFNRHEGRLQVATINPRDPSALEELSGLTELAIEPYVATETAIQKALDELSPDFVTRGGAGAGAADDGVAAPVDAARWDQLWVPPQVGPEEMLATGEHRGPAPELLVATYPELTPMAGVGESEPEVLDEQGFVLRLQDARTRDEVGSLLLRHAAGMLSRVCLFAVYKGRVVGWMARGQSVVVDDVQSFDIPLETPSLFLDVYETCREFVGPIPRGQANELLVRTLGEPPPVEVVVVPIKVKGRVVAFLHADIPGEAALAVPIDELLDSVTNAGLALEILIKRAKIRSRRET